MNKSTICRALAQAHQCLAWARVNHGTWRSIWLADARRWLICARAIRSLQAAIHAPVVKEVPA